MSKGAVKLAHEEIAESQVTDSGIQNENENKYFVFRIGEEEYGIEIINVIEIIGIQQITKIPHIPSFVKGLVNIRGKIIPVIDVRLRFCMESLPYDDRTCIVVIEVDQTSLGLIVDKISEVVVIPPENVMIPIQKSKQEQLKQRYVRRIGKVGNQVKLLLDCQKLIYDQSL